MKYAFYFFPLITKVLFKVKSPNNSKLRAARQTKKSNKYHLCCYHTLLVVHGMANFMTFSRVTVVTGMVHNCPGEGIWLSSPSSVWSTAALKPQKSLTVSWYHAAINPRHLQVVKCRPKSIRKLAARIHCASKKPPSAKKTMLLLGHFHTSCQAPFFPLHVTPH